MAQFPNNLNVTDPQTPVRHVPFPTPPMGYVKRYTDAAVANGTAPLPPPPLLQASGYSMFGDSFTEEDHVIRSLETFGIRRLYPQVYDSKKELKKINLSLVANYLDLLQIISQEPASIKRNEKIDHIRTLFYNMHHLVNEYRPHQARDTLREILKGQIESVKKTNDTAKEYNRKANEHISNLRRELEDFSISQKSAADILSDLDLVDVVKQDPGKWNNSSLRKRKVGESNGSQLPIKVKKEMQSSSKIKQNVVISDKVRNSDLWRQFFDDLNQQNV